MIDNLIKTHSNLEWVFIFKEMIVLKFCDTFYALAKAYSDNPYICVIRII